MVRRPRLFISNLDEPLGFAVGGTPHVLDLTTLSWRFVHAANFSAKPMPTQIFVKNYMSAKVGWGVVFIDWLRLSFRLVEILLLHSQKCVLVKKRNDFAVAANPSWISLEVGEA